MSPIIGALIDFEPLTPIVSADVEQNLASIRTAFNDSAVLTDVARTITVAHTFGAGFLTDSISEKTAGSGVGVDGVLLKDGGANLSGALTVAGATALDTASVGSATAGKVLSFLSTLGKSLLISGVDTSIDVVGSPLLLKESGTERGRMTGGVLAWGTTVTTGAAAGDVVLANNRSVRSVKADGINVASLISLDINNFVTLGYATAHGVPAISLDVDGVLAADTTAMYLLCNTGTVGYAQKIVSVGPADSAGAGYRTLRITN